MNSLKTLRKKNKLTQVDAAKLCGVSRRTYQTYEESCKQSETYDELFKTLKEMCIERNLPPLLNVRLIKSVTSEIFAKYKEVRCAYLFGSYARGEATIKSDVDILIVAPAMGLRFYSLASELEEKLGKTVDLLSHRQLNDNEEFLARVLNEGVKIYGCNINQTSN